MNSTTPTKMKSGDSHERSAENSTDISAVPMSAPRITASAAGRVTRPWPTKDEVMSEVAVLDCTRAVTPMPDRAAVKRLRMLWTRILRRFAPKTRSTPVRTRWVPHTSSATAASRFNRCFMEGDDYTPPSQGLFLAAPHAQQFVQDQADRSDGDRAVGDVEGREVAPGEVEVEEVDHVAVHHPVDHVADRAAQDRRHREREQLLAGVRLQHPDDEDRRGDADRGEEPALPARRI